MILGFVPRLREPWDYTVSLDEGRQRITFEIF